MKGMGFHISEWLKLQVNRVIYFKYILFRGRYAGVWDDSVKTSAGLSAPDPSERKVVYMCDGKRQHGGISERLKGALTTYYETKKRNLPFYIYWVSPFMLSDFLEPAGAIDWQISEEEIHLNYKQSFPFILNVTWNKPMNFLKKCLFLNSFRDKRDLLVYANVMYVEEHFRELYNELFKPTPYLLLHVNAHLKELGDNYCSYTFRFGNLLGDFKDNIGEPLSESSKKSFIEKNISELKKLLDNQPANTKALVTSDSNCFLKEVIKADERIYVVDMEMVHVDFAYNASYQKEIWLKSFLDMYLIKNAEKVFQLRTGKMYNSGFPKFASVLGDKEYVYHEF